jgi:diguanylate cyclase (GGDEF)-like protein
MLPQLFFGLIALIVLFNLYIILQRRDLTATRHRLIQELIFNERMEAVSLLDPVTQLYNRRAMEQMVAHEVARSNRLGTRLSFVILDIHNFDVLRSKLRIAEIDQFLYEAAQLVKSTLRGSDMLFRYKTTQFLAVMPDTAEQQVGFAIKRLQGDIDRYNLENHCAELEFSYGVAEYVQRSRITDALTEAERKAILSQHDFAQLYTETVERASIV